MSENLTKERSLSQRLLQKVGAAGLAVVVAAGAGLGVRELYKNDKAEHPQQIETAVISPEQRRQLDQIAEGSAREILDPANKVIDQEEIEILNGNLVVSGREEQDNWATRGNHYVYRTISFAGGPAATDPASVTTFLNAHPHMQGAESRLDGFYEDFSASVVVADAGESGVNITVTAPKHNGYNANTLPEQFYKSQVPAQAFYVADGFGLYPPDKP